MIKKAWRNAAMITLLMASALSFSRGNNGKKPYPTTPPGNNSMEELIAHSAHPVSIPVSTYPSQAVIILQGAENIKDDPLKRTIIVDRMQKDSDQMQRALRRHKIPVHVIGNPDNGFTLEEMQKEYVRYINAYGYQSVTTLVMCHGVLYGGFEKDPDLLPRKYVEDRLEKDAFLAMQLGYDKTTGKRKHVSLRRILKAVSDSALVANGATHGLVKNDAVVFSCYGGAAGVAEVNELPKGSTLTAHSSPNKVVSKTTFTRVAKSFHRYGVKDGVDGLDFLRPVLYGNAQTMDRDAMLGVSGWDRKISLDSVARVFLREKDIIATIDDVYDTPTHRLGRKRLTSHFYQNFKNQAGLSYAELGDDNRSFLQGVVMDQTMTFTGEPTRLKKYQVH